VLHFIDFEIFCVTKYFLTTYCLSRTINAYTLESFLLFFPQSSIQCIGGLQVLFPLLEQVKYTESSTEKLDRDICFPPIRDCEAVATRELSIINENPTNDVTEPITFNHIGQTSSEDEASLNGAVDRRTAHDVLEQKPEKYEIDHQLMTDGCQQGDDVQDGTLDSSIPKGQTGGDAKMRGAGSFLVIESPYVSNGYHYS